MLALLIRSVATIHQSTNHPLSTIQYPLGACAVRAIKTPPARDECHKHLTRNQQQKLQQQLQQKLQQKCSSSCNSFGCSAAITAAQIQRRSKMILPSR